MIIRSEKNKNYTTVSNIALNDNNLSLKAKGLWAYLMTKPDGWEITISGATSQLKESKDAIRAGFNELEEAGYLVRGANLRNDKGQYYNESATLYEKPQTALEKPTQDNPTQENPTQVITDKVNTDKVTILSKDNIGASSGTVGIPLSSFLKKQEKMVYGDKEVNALIETFTSLTGLRLMKMAEQRRYASLLIKANGLDDCLAACAVVADIMQDQYAPRISDLKTLYYKFGDLQLYARKQSPTEVKKPVDLDEL